MKKKLSLIMGLLLILAWYTTISSWFGNGEKYQGYIDEAKRLEEKGLYLDAIASYEQAKELKADSLEVDERIADAYMAMGNQKEYKKCLSGIIASYGPVEEDVVKLYEFYQKYSSERSLIDWICDMHDKYSDNSLIKEYYNSVKGVYSEEYMSLDYIGSFNGKYAEYKQEGKYGLLDEEGEVFIEAVYDEIKYSKDKITVKDGNDYYLINSDGYKTDMTETKYEYVGRISQDRIVAKKDGKYGYLNKNMEEKLDFVYSAATSFYNGIAAVKQGDKWALINKKGENVTDYIYDDVAVNSMDICNACGIIAVKQGNEWSFIDEKGEPVGNESYEDVKAFESKQPCAVSRKGKWGFADKEGKLVIDCSYQDAKSFTDEYAPVCKDNLWGYIDLENFEAIKCTFSDAGYMTEGGIAPIAHDGVWTLIKLQVKS